MTWPDQSRGAFGCARSQLAQHNVRHPDCNAIAGASPCALIFINDPEVQPASRAPVLSTLYRWIPAERRLCDPLWEGSDLATAAERMRIAIETASFMLKSEAPPHSEG